MVERTDLEGIPLERLAPEVVLERTPLFAGVTPDRLAALARVTGRRRAVRGAAMVHQGEPLDGLHIVLRGRVHLTHELATGREWIAACLGRGELFGEGSVVPGARASSAVVCALPSEFLYVPGPALADAMAGQPQALLRVVEVQNQRLRELEALAGRLAVCAVGERLAYTLARLAARHGRRGATFAGRLLLPAPTRTELAAMVGTCRETVSRALNALRCRGWISGAGQRMFIAEDLLADYLP